jgi:hypothetical protein
MMVILSESTVWWYGDKKDANEEVVVFRDAMQAAPECEGVWRGHAGV